MSSSTQKGIEPNGSYLPKHLICQREKTIVDGRVFHQDQGLSCDAQPVSLVFSGVGSLWPGMAAQISNKETVFKAALASWSALFEEELGWSVASMVSDVGVG
jgi:acyl transferase domain-containing protein